MTLVNTDIQKKAIFVQEFKNVVETKNILSEVATKAVSRALKIFSPFTSVGVAKSYVANCTVPIASKTVSQDSLELNRNIGNAITDCEEEFDYSRFNLQASWRGDLYASVQKKQNLLAVSDVVAAATVVALAEDLSTADKVRTFLLTVKQSADKIVGLKQNVDGATIKRAPLHGKPFVACGSEAFVQITSMVASIVSQSSLKGMDGNIVTTPFGVTIIDLGDAAANTKRLIYGVGGVPTIAYREDKIDVGMGELTSTSTAVANDLDVLIGDSMLDKTWYIYAKTKGMNGIFSNVQSLVSTGLMA